MTELGPEERGSRPWLIWTICFLLVLVALLTLLLTRSHARDLDGRYAQSPHREWVNKLKSGKGMCCSYADGYSVADAVLMTEQISPSKGDYNKSHDTKRVHVFTPL